MIGGSHVMITLRGPIDANLADAASLGSTRSMPTPSRARTPCSSTRMRSRPCCSAPGRSAAAWGGGPQGERQERVACSPRR
jgi:hypothetical protein